ncbi:MAG TPA: cysteine desulfurase family protein, partial [Miltoncostaeaceae bacterium]|nr:cysteine desulfurase family protein [Miltoncostaeaceae bacterium]
RTRATGTEGMVMHAYLDHAASAPLDPRIHAVLRDLTKAFGAPGGLHRWAERPALVLEEARAHVAALVGAEPEEVIFTAGATEARNLAIKGLYAANTALGSAIVTTAVEHPAVLSACRSITRTGGRLTLVPVDARGLIDPAALGAAIDVHTALVSIHHAQGEIGAVQDLPALVDAARAARADVRIHLDAAQTAGLLPIDMHALGVDAVTIGGWPIGAPPWVGALILRAGARLHPLIEGGLQEHGKRAGAENVPAIAALGEAARIARQEFDARAEHMTALSQRLIAGLLRVPDVRLNGPRTGRLPGNVQVSVGWVEGESLVLALAARGVACSPGSACTAHGGKAAPTLEAIGLEAPWTYSAVLFSLGPQTTEEEIDYTIGVVGEEVARLRRISPIAPRQDTETDRDERRP